MNHKAETHIRIKTYCSLGNELEYLPIFDIYADCLFSGWNFEASRSSETSASFQHTAR